MRMFVRVILTTLLVAACGGDSSGPATPASVVGVWNVAVNTGSGLGLNATMTLAQTGVTVTGTGQITSGPAITITGTVDGKRVTLHVVQGEPCVGTLDLNGTVNDTGLRISGSVTGTDCHGSATATFSASRQ